MGKRLPSRTLAVFVLCVLAGAFAVARSQTSQGDCPALVDRVLTAVNTSCGGLGRNSACYGYKRVDAIFSEAMPEGFFNEPGDTAGLTTLQSIHTAPLLTETDELGVAVMKVQANLPNTLPGQAVTFLLIGDATVENAVEPDTAFPSQDPISVSAASPVYIYSQPDLNSNLVGSATQGSEFLADAVSPDGVWTRILFDNRPSWLYVISLIESEPLYTLPIVDKDSRTPMQAFYFETGVGQPSCREAPNSIVVQGPEDFSVDITANGVDIRVSSTVVLRTTADKEPESGSSMEVLSLSGAALINPDTPDEVLIPAGFSVEAGLESSEAGQPGVVGEWTEPEPLAADQQDQFSQIAASAPESVMNYTFDLPDQEDVEQGLALLSSSETPTGTPTSTDAISICVPNAAWLYTYVVQPGDTLAEIAANMAVTLTALQEGNCIADAGQIFAGQVLRVPSPVAPPSPTPTPVPPTNTLVPPPPPPTATMAPSNTPFIPTATFTPPVISATFTPSITITVTPSFTPTIIISPTITPTFTVTPAPSSTDTPTPTPFTTPTLPPTPTAVPTSTLAPTSTDTPSPTP